MQNFLKWFFARKLCIFFSILFKSFLMPTCFTSAPTTFSANFGITFRFFFASNFLSQLCVCVPSNHVSSVTYIWDRLMDSSRGKAAHHLFRSCCRKWRCDALHVFHTHVGEPIINFLCSVFVVRLKDDTSWARQKENFYFIR